MVGGQLNFNQNEDWCGSCQKITSLKDHFPATARGFRTRKSNLLSVLGSCRAVLPPLHGTVTVRSELGLNRSSPDPGRLSGSAKSLPLGNRGRDGKFTDSRACKSFSIVSWSAGEFGFYRLDLTRYISACAGWVCWIQQCHAWPISCITKWWTNIWWGTGMQPFWRWNFFTIPAKTQPPFITCTPEFLKSLWHCGIVAVLTWWWSFFVAKLESYISYAWVLSRATRRFPKIQKPQLSIEMVDLNGSQPPRFLRLRHQIPHAMLFIYRKGYRAAAVPVLPGVPDIWIAWGGVTWRCLKMIWEDMKKCLSIECLLKLAENGVHKHNGVY